MTPQTVFWDTLDAVYPESLEAREAALARNYREHLARGREVLEVQSSPWGPVTVTESAKALAAPPRQQLSQE